jgi:superfamily I DNA and/or RNA helicase
VTEDAQRCSAEVVRATRKNDDVIEALDTGAATVAAGTAWLWSREDMMRKVDVLFVDEAGQMSLANVLAVAQGARNLVLLGDPQQLEQPLRGAHPPGAEASALSHLLGDAPTIAVHAGLFLERTWRLHPNICRFTSELFYEGRLFAEPAMANQEVVGAGPLSGSGLRWVPVEHRASRSESAEEAAVVARLVRTLTGGATWTDADGTSHAVRLRDVLVVAPYNAQVAAIGRLLPPEAEGVRVGTVDRFQGQQAPVVIYSLTTSSPEDAPRGLEFLYSLNRLNVATSRARCVAIVVGNPRLLDAYCRTPRQVRLVNALCRYVEHGIEIRAVTVPGVGAAPPALPDLAPVPPAALRPGGMT